MARVFAESRGRFGLGISWANPEGGGEALKSHKNVGFFSNTGPDPLENQSATNVGPPSARQRNAI